VHEKFMVNHKNLTSISHTKYCKFKGYQIKIEMNFSVKLSIAFLMFIVCLNLSTNAQSVNSEAVNQYWSKRFEYFFVKLCFFRYPHYDYILALLIFKDKSGIFRLNYIQCKNLFRCSTSFCFNRLRPKEMEAMRRGKSLQLNIDEQAKENVKKINRKIKYIPTFGKDKPIVKFQNP
jgi:hypothetical protein